MAKGAVLSNEDKDQLKRKLCIICENWWGDHGYKKTSINELCSQAKISIGTFYSLYKTKEDLFYETIENIQNDLIRRFEEGINKNPTKAGFANGLKMIFRVYDNNPFLYETNTPDFLSFVGKLPQERVEKLQIDNANFFRKAIETARLKLNIDENQAFGIFSALISSIISKKTLVIYCNYINAFDYMVDCLVEQIFQ